MAKIGIVDDRKDLRETLSRLIDVSLKINYSEWSVIDIDPFENVEDYFSWITENDIAILILDEKLQEIKSKVKYNGSDLIKEIRKRLKDFPVFAITSYPGEPDLTNQFSLFDEILDRDEFTDKTDDYISRFIRSGQRFLETYSAQLLRISELSEKIALGKASDDEKNELKTLQTLLGLLHSDNLSREDWLKRYENKLEELEKISSKIDQFLKDKEE